MDFIETAVPRCGSCDATQHNTTQEPHYAHVPKTDSESATLRACSSFSHKSKQQSDRKATNEQEYIIPVTMVPSLSWIPPVFTEAGTANAIAFICMAVIAAHLVLGKAGSRSGKIDPNDTRKRLIVVSGCDRGFGRLLVEQLSDNPRYIILALTLKQESAIALGKLVPGRLVAMKCDVTSDTDIASLEKAVAGMVSNPEVVLHTIVNNAGIVDPGDFVWFRDISSFQRVMDVNFFGCLRVTKALLPHMIETSESLSEGGRILNLSSVCGKVVWPRNSAYCASKHAMEGWSDALRIELSKLNIRVVKLRPGGARTDMIPDYFARVSANRENAPDSVKQLFDLKRIENVTQQEIKNYDLGADDDSQSANRVVEVLERLVETDIKNMPSAEWIGFDARVIFRFLSWSPDFIRDKISADIPFDYIAPTHPKRDADE